MALVAPPADDAAREEFPRHAEIAKVERLGRGVTASRRATPRLNGYEHDAHVQTVDIQHQPLASFANFEPGFTVERLRGLDRARLEAQTGEWLPAAQIDGVMARRDLIVQTLAARVKQSGERKVIFEYEEPW